MKIIAISNRMIDPIPVPRDLPKFCYDLLSANPCISTAHFDDGRTYSVYCAEVNNWGGPWTEDAKAYYAALQAGENAQ